MNNYYIREPYPNELVHVDRCPYENELYHFGILGMKWGVRRYQNPDGSLTPAGERRYNRNSKFKQKIDKENEKKAKLEKLREAPEYESFSRLNDIVKNNIKAFLMPDDSYHGDRRGSQAADTGLRAFNKMGPEYETDYGKEDEETDDSLKDWLLEEEPGLAIIADLANQGKSKKEIISLINDAYEMDYEVINAFSNGKVNKVLGELASTLGWYGGDHLPEKYIDTCIRIASHSKNKH